MRDVSSCVRGRHWLTEGLGTSLWETAKEMDRRGVGFLSGLPNPPLFVDPRVSSVGSGPSLMSVFECLSDTPCEFVLCESSSPICFSWGYVPISFGLDWPVSVFTSMLARVSLF